MPTAADPTEQLVRSRQRVTDHGEVFTPRWLVDDMLDLVGGEAARIGSRILEPACGSGNFLVPVLERKLAAVAAQRGSEDDRGRLALVALRGVCGIELLADNAAECRERLLRAFSSFVGEDSPLMEEARAVVELTIVQGDALAMTGSAGGPIAFPEWTPLEGEGFERRDVPYGEPARFDVIVGNPPYQRDRGDTSDTPIYQLFVRQAIALRPRFLTMVTPSRWFTGGKGLAAYRAAMIADRRLRVVVDFPDSKDTFPGVEIKGGVSYFLWDRESEGDCRFETRAKGGSVSTGSRDLRDGRGVVVRDNRASSIIGKVGGAGLPPLSESVSPQTPFGIRTNFAEWEPVQFEGAVRLYRRGLDEAWVDPAHVTARHDWIPRPKVILSYAYNGGDALPHQVTGRPIVVPGNSACTQTYMVAGVFDDPAEAALFARYLESRLVRFLIRQRKISQHNRPDTFAFVPRLPMDRLWTDDALYERFGISEPERAYIESQVRGMTAPGPIG